MFQELLEQLKTILVDKLGLEDNSKIPEPVGPLELIRRFDVNDVPLTKQWAVEFSPPLNFAIRDSIFIDQDAWRIEGPEVVRLEDIEGRTVRLFEVPEPKSKECLLVCRAQIKTDNLQKKASLNMGIERPFKIFGLSGGSDTKQRFTSFSRTTDWKIYEIRYHFKKIEQPGKIKVDVEFESSGTIWIKYIEILQAPVSV